MEEKVWWKYACAWKYVSYGSRVLLVFEAYPSSTKN